MDRSADWIRQATRDMERAKLDLEYAFYEWACFTSQQAAEKAVKAVYQAHNKYVRGHSVLKLLEGLKDNLAVPPDIFHLARVLDRYYIESRYPNGFPEGSPQDYFDEQIAREAYNAGREIVQFCAGIIGKL
jgi:HEPN domain-containing protein